MLEQYVLRMPKEVYSGENALDRVTTIVRGNYSKVALFTDKGIRSTGILDKLISDLEQCGVETMILDQLPAEPTCDQAQAVIDQFKALNADFIIAAGGGSVMDIAKLASIAATDAYGVRDLLDNPALGKKTVKTLLIPTTAGTGSEATPNSIVSVPEKELKVGIVNTEMIADAVILDGSMISNLPKKIAASTGIDALAHAIECYTSNKANPFSNLFAMEALKLIFANIETACENSDAVTEKTNMLIAAFYAGVAITASGTTAVHALSYPLGGKYHIPHGVSNAMMLLPVLNFNKPNCYQEFAEVYDVVNPGGTESSCEAKSDWVLNRIDQMIERLQIPKSLTAFGVGKEDLEILVEAGMNVQRLLVNNKRLVTADDARDLYLEIM